MQRYLLRIKVRNLPSDMSVSVLVERLSNQPLIMQGSVLCAAVGQLMGMVCFTRLLFQSSLNAVLFAEQKAT